MKRDDSYAIIMAGGRGERFWPQSRASHPKQLLRLLGNLTLIEQAVERLLPLFEPSNIVIITNNDYVAPMQSLLSMLPDENIIGEPSGRDTAPCIALALAYVKAVSKSPSPLLAILPSDHVINDTASFRDVLADSLEVAKRGSIVTIGVNPSFPSTGYGYICTGETLPSSYKTSFHTCKGFKEKPSLKVAEEYLKSGSYKWNCGIFVASAATLSDAFAKHAPGLSKSIPKMEESLRSDRTAGSLAPIYESLERISFDYAVMEKSQDIVVAECTFDWDDVGSWTSMRNQIRPESNNNVIRGLHVGIDSKDCIVVGDSTHLIATVDVQDLVIVSTEDATLVCNAKSAQRVKELVQIISSRPDLSAFK